MNYSKINDKSSLHSEQQDNNDSCKATNIAQELDIDKPIKSKWEKYLDSPKKESSSDAEDLSFDNICEAEDMITKEESLCSAVNNNSFNFGNTLDDCNFGNEDIATHNKTENLCSTVSTGFNYNSNIEDKCNLQDNSKSSRDHNDIANIFETYSELDDPFI